MTSEAYFAGGCFWCTENLFSRLKGVKEVISGYAGGLVENPTYMEVSTGQTNHAETVKVVFDPQIISYNQLLEIFWFIHNPTTLNQQGADTGTQYRSMIFYTDDLQREEAEKSLEEFENSGKYEQPVVTEIVPLNKFYPAEEYHQKYYQKNPTQPYCILVVGPKKEKFKAHFKHLLK